jgi:hypothetical protein
MVSFKARFILVGLLGIMMGFQNCGPSAMSMEEVGSGGSFSKSHLSEVLKPQTQWELKLVNEKPLPQGFFLNLDFTERPQDPELLCAGACPLVYDLKLSTNCGEDRGTYVIKFDMVTGLQEHFFSIDKRINSLSLSEEEQTCSYLEWSSWARDFLTKQEDLRVSLSESSLDQQSIVIDSKGQQFIFKKTN